MKSTQKLNVVRKGKVVGELSLKFSDGKDGASLCEISVTGYINKQYVGLDFYDIFLEIRNDIELSNDALIACYGSMKQFFLTGMSRDWSNGLKGYLRDELTLDDEQVSVYKPVDSNQYNDLCSLLDQKKYREKFRKENEGRILEKNRLLEEEAKKNDRELGGVRAIKGFPKDLL